MNIGFYSYGKRPLFSDYKNAYMLLRNNSTIFNLSLNLSHNKTSTINSVSFQFPLDYLGFIHIGHTRLNIGRLVSLPWQYIGLNFYNPEFSFGVFKEDFKATRNTFTLLSSIQKKSIYGKALLTKDKTEKTALNLVSGYNKRYFQIEGAMSLSPYLSFALYTRAMLKGEKSSLSMSITKYFKNFYAAGRRISPFLSINSSFSFRAFEHLFYNNQAGFIDRGGNKTYTLSNNIVYNSPKLGQFSLFYNYANKWIPGFSYNRSLNSVLFNFSIISKRKSYSITFRRKPLVIRLSRDIHENETGSRISSQLDFGKFSTSSVYFFSEKRQYFISRNTVKFHGLNLLQNIYLYTRDTLRNLQFSTGVNFYSPLKVPSLSTIKGEVYFDKNGNGIYDKYDKPLDSVKIILDNDNYTFTNKKGHFTFKFVPRGHHKIRLDLGLLPAELGPMNGYERDVTVGFVGEKYVEFKVAALGEVEGRLFIDNNVDGVFDGDDVPLEGCIVSLNGKRTWTWKKGKYKFSNVPPGSYRVQVEYCPQKLTPLSKKYYDIYVMPEDRIKGLDFPFLAGEEIKVKVKRF